MYKDPEKKRSYARAYYKANAERLAEKGRNYRKANLEKRHAIERTSRLKSDFGMSLADYNEMLQKQNGRCAICKSVGARKLDVDHCHATGVVRGLLCHVCNKALGSFKDSVELLEAAIVYLQKGS